MELAASGGLVTIGRTLDGDPDYVQLTDAGEASCDELLAQEPASELVLVIEDASGPKFEGLQISARFDGVDYSSGVQRADSALLAAIRFLLCIDSDSLTISAIRSFRQVLSGLLPSELLRRLIVETPARGEPRWARLKLVIPDAQWARAPWELLTADPPDGQGLLLSDRQLALRNVAIIRTIGPATGPPLARCFGPEEVAIVVLRAPAGTPRIGVPVFAPHVPAKAIFDRTAVGGTVAAVLAPIIERKPRLLHIIGHGSLLGGIWFGDELVDCEQLVEAGVATMDAVIVSSCYGATGYGGAVPLGQQLCELGVPDVVAIEGQFEDSHAAGFDVELHRQLAMGRNLERAVMHARHALAGLSDGLPQWCQVRHYQRGCSTAGAPEPQADAPTD